MGGENSQKIIKGIKNYYNSNTTFYNIFGDKKLIDPLIKIEKFEKF